MLKLVEVFNDSYIIHDDETGESFGMQDTAVAYKLSCGIEIDNCTRTVNGFHYWLNGEEARVRVQGVGTVIRQYNLDGEMIAEYASFCEAGRVLGCSPSWIAHCCSDKNKTCHGFAWRRACDDEISHGDLSQLPPKLVEKRIRQYTLRGKFVKEYATLQEAADKTNVSTHGIAQCCKKRKHHSTAGGFAWRYSDDDDLAVGGKVDLPNRRAVRQYTADGKLVAEYIGAREAEKLTDCKSSNITACCQRKPRHNTVKGFVWRYADDDEFAVKEAI